MFCIFRIYWNQKWLHNLVKLTRNFILNGSKNHFNSIQQIIGMATMERPTSLPWLPASIHLQVFPQIDFIYIIVILY
jgi:hypothetical protein